MSKKNKTIGFTMRGKKLFDLKDLDINTVCDNLKRIVKDYKDKLKELNKTIAFLKSDKKYKDLEKRNKALQEHIWHNCLCDLTDKEVELIKEFKDKHYKKCAEKDIKEMRKQGISPATGFGKGSTWIYTIENTSLGEIISIKCPDCGEELDITDQNKF